MFEKLDLDTLNARIQVKLSSPLCIGLRTAAAAE